MRVIGGSARGMRLNLVPGEGTRPILDRVKTALFDILRPRLEGMHVLDLFAGSGGVGIESLSQGAEFCTFNDRARKAALTIRKNLEVTGFVDRAEVRNGDAFSLLKETDKVFDLIYVAPPQYEGLWEQAMAIIDNRPTLVRAPTPGENEDVLKGLVIVQIDPKEYHPLTLKNFGEIRQTRYGNTLLIFYVSGVADEPSDTQAEED